MPQLLMTAEVRIPFSGRSRPLSRSLPESDPAIRRQLPFNEGKAAMRSSPEPPARIYGEGSLSVKPSEVAPRKARIHSRNTGDNGVRYHLKIGELDVIGVGLNEILDYVSSKDLEEFEMKQFEEERVVIRIAEAEVAEERRLDAIEASRRNKQWAKRKGTIVREDLDDVDDEASDEDQQYERGRARPSYAHVYKVEKVRRRRKRDPRTNELLPLSDDDRAPAQHDASVSKAGRVRTAPDLLARNSIQEEPKRRRRKRDPKTGELLPLKPEPRARYTVSQSESPGPRSSQSAPRARLPDLPRQKRPRRRRHPLTNELMPLGWKYNPDAPDQRTSSDIGPISPKFDRLSLSQGNPAKRRKRSASEEFSENVAISARPTSSSMSVPARGTEQLQWRESQIFTLASGAYVDSRDENISSAPQVPSNALRTSLGRPPPVQRQGTSSQGSSPEPNNRAPVLNSMTSILHPAARNVATSSEDEELQEDEYFVEAILSHHLSDPQTHNPNFGTEPIMLFKVKWEGSDELTWEPIDSFPDVAVVQDYQRRAGLEVSGT